MSITCVDINQVEHTPEVFDHMERLWRDVDEDYVKALPFFIHATIVYIALLVEDKQLPLREDIHHAIRDLLSVPQSVHDDDDTEHEVLDIDQQIAAMIAAGDGVKLGRIGLRRITSDWAQKKYPRATFEAVITLVDEASDAVHVMIVYM